MTPRSPKKGLSKLLPYPSERLSVSADDLEDLLREALRAWDLDEAVCADTVVRDVVGGFRRMYARQVEAPGLVRLSEVQPERVDWLWPGRIPMGRLTLLDGDPGLGKSTLTMDLAARVTTGAPMPYQGSASSPPMGVVLLTAEDGLADTIRPRLDAAGADPTRVTALRPSRVRSDVTGKEDWRLPSVQHVEDLEVAIQDCGAGLVIVDPLSAFLGSGVDGHRDSDVRSALAGLADLAERTKVAVLAVRHLRKAGGTNPLYAGGGSIAFIAAARAAHLLARDPEDESRLILAPLKNNLAPPCQSLALRIVPGPGMGTRVSWEGETGHTAGQLLRTEGEGERSAREEAREMLQVELELGPVPLRVLRARAKELGIGWRTVQRAKKDLGIRSRRDGYGDDGRWFWVHPDKDRQTPGALKPATDLAPFEGVVEPPAESPDDEYKGRQASTFGALSDGDVGDEELSRCADCGREVEHSPAFSVQRCFPCGVKAGRRDPGARDDR